MKTNYQKSDRVTITKIGHFQGLQGEVLSSNEVDAKVLIDGTGLDWFFTFNEIQGGKPIMKGDPENITHVAKAAVKVVKQVKRAYNRRPQNEPVKQKRKYTKRLKN